MKPSLSTPRRSHRRTTAPSSRGADEARSATSKALPQRDQAYRGLRRLLILQRVPPGRLREPQWAAQLGVNRMALREAFARLEAEGLIERGPKTGYFVPELTREDIGEILAVRSIIECGAIDMLCAMPPRTRRSRLKAMAEACDDLEDRIAKDYLLGASEADREFHEALIDAAGNTRLSAIYLRAPLPMIHGQIVATDRWKSECERTLAEHRRILSEIRQGRAEEANTIMREHLNERYLVPIAG